MLSTPLAPRFRGAVLIMLGSGMAVTPVSATEHVPAAIDIAVGSSSNSKLHWADFVISDPPAAIQLNTDANLSSGFNSVEFHTCTEPGPRLDILAANTNGGDILLYPGGANRWATASSICAGTGTCPARPDGLSSSNAGLLAAANIGTAGTVPELWFYAPSSCGVFEPGKRSGQFTVAGIGPVGEIRDTEYVRVPGGGLEVGDLLVATANPSTIARVPKADIDNILGGGSLSSAQLLVPPSFFGSAAPAALAFVPGTSGVGSPEDGTSESEALLVAVPAARILQLRFGQVDYGVGTFQNFIFFDQELGNGPLGIAAGTGSSILGALETYMVVADRQLGRVIRVKLDVNSSTGALSLAPDPIQSIKSDLQFPRGVAFNSNAVIASSCMGEEGCAIGGAIQLILPGGSGGSGLSTAGFSTQQSHGDEDAIVIGELFLVEDTRGTANTSLQLPAALGADFTLPAACRGFDLDDDASTPPIVPVVLLTTNVEATPGTLANVQELLSGIFPQLQNCDETGARLYHRSDPGALFDKTIVCTNPSRSANGGLQSPHAACADRFYPIDLQANQNRSQNEAFKAEVLARVTHLRTVVEALPLSYGALRSELLAKLDSLVQTQQPRGPLRQNNRYPTADDYLVASGILSAGAKLVLDAQSTFAADLALAPNTWGDLLTLWTALAFYTSETGAKVDFCPLTAIDGIGAHLPGVSCGSP
jgi:hypothetical protein